MPADAKRDCVVSSGYRQGITVTSEPVHFLLVDDLQENLLSLQHIIEQIIPAAILSSLCCWFSVFINERSILLIAKHATDSIKNKEVREI